MSETMTATPASASVAGEVGGASSVVESPSTIEEQPLGAPSPGADSAEPEAGDESLEAGAQPEQSTETPEPEGDGRTLPNAIKALKETNPEAYKTAKGIFFENRAYKQTFPTVAAANAAKQTLDLVGGEQGIVQMQSDMGEFKEVATQFMNGDPAFITDLAETDPVAFATHVPTMLNKLKDVDKQLYNREMAKRIHGEHAAIGLRPALENAYQMIQSGKTEDALQLLGKLAGWHDNIEGLAKQEDDPRYKALQDELRKTRNTQAQEQDKKFFDGYRGEATKAINAAADKIFSSYLKDSKLDPDLKDQLVRESISLANQSLAANETYKKQRDLLFGRRDSQASVRFAVSQFQQALGPAIQQIIRKQARIVKAFGKQAALGSNLSREQRPPAAKPNAVPAGWTKVASAPKNIDRNRTTASMILNEKKAILNDGSKVTWAT